MTRGTPMTKRKPPYIVYHYVYAWGMKLTVNIGKLRSFPMSSVQDCWHLKWTAWAWHGLVVLQNVLRSRPLVLVWIIPTWYFASRIQRTGRSDGSKCSILIFCWWNADQQHVFLLVKASITQLCYSPMLILPFLLLKNLHHFMVVVLFAQKAQVPVTSPVPFPFCRWLGRRHRHAVGLRLEDLLHGVLVHPSGSKLGFLLAPLAGMFWEKT